MATYTLQPTVASATLNYQSRQLNDFVLGVMDKIRNADDPTDQVTPSRPIFKRMMQKNGGMLKMEPPSQNLYWDVNYQNVANAVEMSLSNDMKDKDYTQQEGDTRLWYDWIQTVFRMVLPKMQIDNSKGAVEIASLVERKMRQMKKARNTYMNDVLWNGKASNSEKVFGLNDVIRDANTTDPSKGPVGKQTAVSTSWWQPQYLNFNAPFRTVASGDVTSDLFHDDTNSLLSLWFDCTDNDEGDYGEPDLFVTNENLYRFMSALADQDKRVFLKEDKYQLDITDTMVFRSAQVIRDRNAPAASGDPSYGRGFFLNTNFVDMVGCEGIWMQSGDKEAIPGKEGWAWPEYTQFSMVWKMLRCHGVVNNVKPQLIS